jgi:hypothetical protein
LVVEKRVSQTQRKRPKFVKTFDKSDTSPEVHGGTKKKLAGTGHGWSDSTVQSSGDTLLAQDGAVGVEHVVVFWWGGRWLTL